MRNLRRLLPSFRGLVAFEAAGRLSSFTQAGIELGMSQAAVSYAIKALEEDIGQPLFERAHRQVRLTEAGRRLHADVAQGLYQMAHAVDTARTSPDDNVVTLSVSTAFATLWMAPRLQRMRTDLPDIELRLHTSDRDIDLGTEDIPLGIRGGRPKDWPGYESCRFAAEEIIAVASPDYVQTNGLPEEPAELLGHHLAHLDEPYRAAISWEDWLRSAGVAGAKPNRGIRANEYVAVLQMALDGDAVALGWRHLVDVFIRNGRLTQVTDHCFRTGAGLHVVWPKYKALSDMCVDIRDWIVGQDAAIARNVAVPVSRPLARSRRRPPAE